ncbi:MAG: hypothetical protein JO165_08855, partial [Candidatus Eremiobacteraeota bacterium]|nr:hypothetical protein [Candidatus Eremiobacteraeota bacterium]
MRGIWFVHSIVVLALVTGCGGNRTIPSSGAVQPGSLNRAAGSSPVITLNAASSGPSVSADVYGASLDTWYDFLRSFVNPSLRKT